MLRIAIVLFKGNTSSKLNLIFIHFSSQAPEFLVIDLTESLILLHSFLLFLCLD